MYIGMSFSFQIRMSWVKISYHKDLTKSNLNSIKYLNVDLCTNRQWFGNSDADRAIAGGLQNVHGIIQAGALQLSFIHEHESVTG